MTIMLDKTAKPCIWVRANPGNPPEWRYAIWAHGPSPLVGGNPYRFLAIWALIPEISDTINKRCRGYKVAPRDTRPPGAPEGVYPVTPEEFDAMCASVLAAHRLGDVGS